MSWKNYSQEILIENLRGRSWQQFEYLNINEKVELLRMNIIASVAPMVENIIMKEKEMELSWFDLELSQMEIKKISLYNDWKSNKNDINWELYVSQRNEYNKMIRQKKNLSIKNEIVSAGNDQKKMWRSPNKLLPSKKTNVSDEIRFDDYETSVREEICEKFNCFFVESIRYL